MNVADPARELWTAYVASAPEHSRQPMPPVHQFGGVPAEHDGLLELMVAGTKRATAELVTQYGPANGPVPTVGDHWMVADSTGVPVLVLQTTQVRIGTLESVDDAFAFDEGEGDRTRTSWLAAHRHYFAQHHPGGTGLDRALVVFERFAVVWPPECRDPT